MVVFHVLNENGSLEEINDTYITLVPKSKSASSVKEFRPISLCNVIYKIVYKVMAMRLCLVIDSAVGKQQSTFLQGRQVLDNVIIAHEILHTLKQKRQGCHGSMVLKLDMSKVFDRVEWGFLRDLMLKMNFPTTFTNLIIKCLSIVSFLVLVNGEKFGPFLP